MPSSETPIASAVAATAPGSPTSTGIADSPVAHLAGSPYYLLLIGLGQDNPSWICFCPRLEPFHDIRAHLPLLTKNKGSSDPSDPFFLLPVHVVPCHILGRDDRYLEIGVILAARVDNVPALVVGVPEEGLEPAFADVVAGHENVAAAVPCAISCCGAISRYPPGRSRRL